MIITVTAPVGVTGLDGIMELTFNGDLLVFGVPFTYYYDTGNIGNFGTGSWDVVFEIVNADAGNAAGAWSITFILEGDAI